MGPFKLSCSSRPWVDPRQERRVNYSFSRAPRYRAVGARGCWRLLQPQSGQALVRPSAGYSPLHVLQRLLHSLALRESRIWMGRDLGRNRVITVGPLQTVMLEPALGRWQERRVSVNLGLGRGYCDRAGGARGCWRWPRQAAAGKLWPAFLQNTHVLASQRPQQLFRCPNPRVGPPWNKAPRNTYSRTSQPKS